MNIVFNSKDIEFFLSPLSSWSTRLVLNSALKFLLDLDIISTFFHLLVIVYPMPQSGFSPMVLKLLFIFAIAFLPSGAGSLPLVMVID